MAVSWPARIKPDKTPRSQFHHVNDIAPTIYEILDIKPPKVVDGFGQDPIDGVSMVYTFADAHAASHKHTQYFDNNGSRGIYHDGWYACTFGPLVPWDTAGSAAGLKTWDSSKDVWELYDITKDFSQSDNLASKEPRRLEELKRLFLTEAEKNKVFPISAGIWLRIHPEDRIATPYKSWRFDQTTTRMPEFAAPGLGRESNHVVIDAELGANASGVLYALGGASGGLTLYLDHGRLFYEYNMMIIERYIGQSKDKLSAGRHMIEVDTAIAKPGGPATVVMKVDGAEVGQADVKRTVAGAFTASETLDVGVDLGSPVSIDYFDRRPFAFNGKINSVTVELK
jgi:arylsulfatase